MIKFLLLSILLIPACFLQAQDHLITLGPKVGFNSSQLITNIDSLRTDKKGAAHFGAFMRIGRKIYIQPEAIYVLKGGFIESGDFRHALSQEIQMHCISVPVLVGGKLSGFKSFNIRAMAGPTFTYVFDKKFKPSEMVSDWPIKSADDIRNSSWSFQMGGGVDFLIFTIDVRYEFGVDNIYIGTDNFDLRNNLFNLSLGIKLL
jgi:hypothetical protein